MRMPGPNRRGERSMVQFKVSLQPGCARMAEADSLALHEVLRNWSVGVTGNAAPALPLPAGVASTGPEAAGWSIASLAVWIQQQAGHRVSEFGAEADSEEPLIWFWTEYDHPEVGERAAVLALAVVRHALGFRGEDGSAAVPGRQQWHEFREFAQGRCLPLETNALVAAAGRRGIPCFKLDRYPYEPLEGEFRIRPNGLLRLGHGRHSCVLDGTLCVNRAARQFAILRDRQALRTALRTVGVALEDGEDAGEQQILVIGGRPVAVVGGSHAANSPEILSQIGEQCAAVHRKFGLPVFAAAITAHGAWRQLDLAPRLETWFPEGGAGLDLAADMLLEQLYPPGSTCRIPIVSVTGTNGKTTTCTMLRRILLQAGNTPVVECSNGIFVGNRPQGSRRDLGPASTWFALESTDADVAVFEDYFGRINRFGFAYEWSDVAVCTNVTPDHLHHFNVHTLEQLAEVKFAVVSRARHGVVLNADNAGCAGMLSRATARRKVAVSMSSDRGTLARAHSGVQHFCVLEQHEGQDYIMLYDGDTRIPLLAANDIPATRSGQARHNTSNAMHAAAAAWLLGVSVEHIAAALGAFAVDFETCPGRLNEFTGLPFRVIMDYAHNEDGLRQICAFADAQQVAGRKLIKCSFYDDRCASEIRAAVRIVAGHFDLFTCSRFGEKRRVVTENIPEVMQRVLLEEGVAQEAITLGPDSSTALQLTLDQARAGDLVVLLVDSAEFNGLWQKLGRMRAAMESPQSVA